MKKQQKQKRLKNHFDKFPPILREMVMEAMDDDIKNIFVLPSGYIPLDYAFTWYNNNHFSDYEFWEAVKSDAIYHKVWDL